MVKTTVLSTLQIRFVQEYLVDGCGAQAAIRSGVAASGAHVWASRALRITKVAEALAARQSTDAIRLSLRREDVLKGLLEAVDQARVQSNPIAMVSGLREIGKMMGFYAIETKRVELTTGQGTVQANFSAMNDAQLLALIAQGAVAV